MLRLFEASTKRSIRELDGSWRMLPDLDGSGEQKGYPNGLPEAARRTFVPSCWNFELDLFHHYGTVWYETAFEAVEEHVTLVFGAVNNVCDVYVDGAHISHHYGPFCEFSVDLPKLGTGTHRLVLKVNNLQNTVDTIPLHGSDWFEYGGIIRPVEVHSHKSCRLTFHTEYELDVEARAAEVDFVVDITPFTARVRDTLKIQFNGQTVCEKRISIDKPTIERLHARVEDLRLWDIGKGNLYTVSVAFGNDEIRDRIGFRKFEVTRDGFLLNGRPIKLRGVNRHEENYETGFAVTPNQAKRDLAIIQDLGCNMVRGSHYPNAKTTLDMLDEAGLLFWEEIPVWGFNEEQLAEPKVLERGCAMHRELVLRDRNHPCVVIWGMLNEGKTDTEPARRLLRQFRETIRSLDTTRPITYASDRPLTDICQEYADFISINAYFGWYGGGYEVWPQKLAEFRAYADAQGHTDKPIVLSEFGAGGIKGETSFDGMIWSETYQNEYFDWVLPRLCDSELLAGTLIWQYCDTRTSEKRSRALVRPRNFNNKGLLDEHRSPKHAYYTVRRVYRERKAQDQ